MKNTLKFALICSLIFCCTFLSAQANPLAYALDEDGFAYPVPEAELSFPRDHGSHPFYKTEWWYLTGHFNSEDNSQRYGFQLTFFRSAGEPGSNAQQIHMAHAALTNLNTGQFLHEERLNRAGWNAQSAVGHLDLFNGNWSLSMNEDESMKARFSVQSEAIVHLEFIPLKPKTLFGKDGYSRKGKNPSSVSHYITFTRLGTTGTLELNGESYSVTGQTWMDHEFSSSQLEPGQIGWNWTSLILDDGTELMAYVMRRADGKTDPHSTLTLIAADGSKRALSSDAFEWTPQRFWQSPTSGGNYPIDYHLSWNDAGEKGEIFVKANADAQELQGQIGQFQYWEGSSQAYDANGHPIGSGYTELTGYTKSLQGQF